jgi:thioredoxin-dependent peroxiredoxin
MERTGKITIHGNPLTLIGPEITVGSKAPEFKVLDKDLNEVKSSDFSGKVRIISVTPSLDTPVCDIQVNKFNHEAAQLGDNVAVINMSMDLPFALARFCAAAGIDKVKTLSDHREASFGTAYGVLIKELRLLARSIFIIDRNDIVRYVEIVPEMTEHPNYDKVISMAKNL